MAEFVLLRGQVCLNLDQFEAELLRLLLDQLVDLLDIGETAAEPDEDPFARWESEFARGDRVAEAEFGDMDPITERLFPNAYRDDPDASLDFRRFTQAEQQAQKVADARVVLSDLDRPEPAGRVLIPADHLGAWMKTLNAMRLVLSVVLGITDEISSDEATRFPPDDPRAQLHSYFGWLGWLLESLMDAMAARR